MFDEQVDNTLALAQSIQKYLRHISVQSKPSMKLRMEKAFNSPSAKLLRRLQWGKSQSQQQLLQQQQQQQQQKQLLQQQQQQQQQQKQPQPQQIKVPTVLSRGVPAQQDAPSSPRASQSPASPVNLPPMPTARMKSNTVSGRLHSRAPLPLPLTQPKYPTVFE